VAAALLLGPILLFLAGLTFVMMLRRMGYPLGYGQFVQGGFIVLVLLIPAGIVAAVLVLVLGRGGRATSLRTRAFVVIIVAMVIPALLLAGLGTYAYFMSWERATVLYTDQASYQARELSSEIAELSKTPGRFTPAERALLSRAITDQYGAKNHAEGALWSTLSAVRQERVLPVWAVRSLERRGFAIGRHKGPTSPERAEFVAWRVGPSTVRYYMQGWSGTPFMDAYAPLGRLLWIAVFGLALIAALGLLGAWILSRSVVRPVRRLAEASHRIADAGGAAEPVRPAGPRELRDLATSFNDMNAKLAKAQETEQAFLLSVSHELKTPLTSIRGYAEGIGDGTVKPPEGAEVIGAESSRLERLVGDLLESGRMRKSAFTVRREAVDLAVLAQDVVRRYEGTARDAGLTLLMNTDAGGSAVADNDRLLQVVSNLVENAIRCTPAPGTVTITTQPGAVTVADTGRGLTSDDLPRAFERFYLYSRYGNDRPVGTGLGLAIVKELTEAMGGAVSVSSAVGVGTAFTVALPPADEASAAPPQDVTSSTVALPQDIASSTVALPRDDAP
jgi:signal transduction histidine kinase